MIKNNILMKLDSNTWDITNLPYNKKTHWLQMDLNSNLLEIR